MIQLSDIVHELRPIQCHGLMERTISSITADSRKVVEGAMFVAIRGTALDGHQFIDNAIEDGARVIIVEQMPRRLDERATYVQVNDSKVALAEAARGFYDYPDNFVYIVGVTGTNGKTTVATLAWQLFNSVGIKCGLFSTVANYIGDWRIESTHTTPDIVQFYAILRRMVDEDCQVVCMEVSSHALDQDRLLGVRFDTAVFTNITRDHLDYHGTFDEYIRAKKKLFDQLAPDAKAILYADDRHSDVMIQNCSAIIKRYSTTGRGEYHARILENSIHGLTLRRDGRDYTFRLVGKYNALNLLAALAIVLEYDIDLSQSEDVLVKWTQLNGAEGRFEIIRGEGGKTGIVDYAHTPDAITEVLASLNQMRPKDAQLITVIGCGGNRDRGKRPLMAKSAVSGSDIVILTSDNPRDEPPEVIINDMFNGIDGTTSKAKVIKQTDREEAIKMACMLAKDGDMILVAGKGHEKYQEIKGRKLPFDDKKVLQQYI